MPTIRRRLSTGSSLISGKSEKAVYLQRTRIETHSQNLIIMKKVLFIIAAAALMLSCGGNSNQKKTSEGSESSSKEEAPAASKSKLTIGDKFAFAGLESDALVPSFATEIGELQTDPRSEAKPMKDAVYFYTGPDISAIPAEKVQEYLQKVYSAVKKAADDGLVYKAKGISGDELGEEITTPPTADKPAATVMYLYKHNGVWFNITAGHKAYFHKFTKDYGEKFIGVGVSVKEMLGEVK